VSPLFALANNARVVFATRENFLPQTAHLPLGTISRLQPFGRRDAAFSNAGIMNFSPFSLGA
jgi:hypothetical protein